MRRYGLLFWLIFIVAIVLGVLLGRIDSLRKELTRARQSVVIAQQQTQTQEGRIAQLSKEISLLSRKLEAAKTYQLLSYKLKSGDTLYGLFGHAWKK